MLLAFLFFGFSDEFVPEAGDIVKFRDSAARRSKSILDSGLFVDEFSVLSLESFLLLLPLAVQNGEAELQVADLAIINLALLLQFLVLVADRGQSGSQLSRLCLDFVALNLLLLLSLSFFFVR